MLLNKKDAVCSRFFRGCSVFSAFTARADRGAVKQIFLQTQFKPDRFIFFSTGLLMNFQ